MNGFEFREKLNCQLPLLRENVLRGLVLRYQVAELLEVIVQSPSVVNLEKIQNFNVGRCAFLGEKVKYSSTGPVFQNPRECPKVR